MKAYEFGQKFENGDDILVCLELSKAKQLLQKTKTAVHKKIKKPD